MKLATVLALVLTAAAGPALAENWNPFSRSRTTLFMADVDSIKVDGDVTSIIAAAAPRQGEAGDFSYTTDRYEFHCRAGEWRSVEAVEYGPDGAEAARYPDDTAQFERIGDGTLPAFLREVACEGVRSDPPVWPSVRAFIEAGRG